MDEIFDRVANSCHLHNIFRQTSQISRNDMKFCIISKTGTSKLFNTFNYKMKSYIGRKLYKHFSNILTTHEIKEENCYANSSSKSSLI